MVITKTPFRISFLGGGTDYPGFFQQYSGSVISTTIDKYCYVNVRHLPPFFEYKNSITYSKTEHTNTLDEIEHPLVRNAMKMLDMREISLTYDADIPARSGIGSSSAFAVGILQAFYAVKGKMVGKRRLAEEAVYLERVLCAEDGGWQDQIASAYGNLNRIDFIENNFIVRPLIIDKERKEDFNKRLMLFFTGFSRISAEVAIEQVKAVKSKSADLLEMLGLVDAGMDILTSKCDINDFGRLLNETWLLKRSITDKISTDTIDNIYQIALKAGALGGKLLGAGGGGFLLFFVESHLQKNVRNALSSLLYVPFEFEDEGAQVLYYSPEDYKID